MPAHIDPNNPDCKTAAAEILRRHNEGQPEANITTAVRDFLTITGLVKPEHIVEENPPAEGSRRAVDLTALDTFIEFKRRIGTTGGFNPDPKNVDQLDDYLAQSQKHGRVRMGILTDGKYWLLRWPGAGPPKTVAPYAYTLEDPDRWFTLYEWLRDNALSAEENKRPTRDTIAESFGPDSPSYERDIAALKALYVEYAGQNTIKVKRQLWHDLLRTALGEIAQGPEEMDDLFVRHTYLTAVIGMVVQASFGIDIRQLAENNPFDLLQGRKFQDDTGIQGVVESDFFAWPTEVGGRPLLKTMARRIARFDWRAAPSDVAAILYVTVIPPAERRQLGEYYTPAWLAGTMVRELVTDPVNQRVLDPACGSGAFLAEAVEHFIGAAGSAGLPPRQVLNKLLVSVIGIDVHPVAVHLARAAWVLAARPVIADAQVPASIPIPVYLGDSLQLRFRTGDMFAEREVTIQVRDEENTELVFPISLVDRAEQFDSFMGHVVEYIETGQDPQPALDDNYIIDERERQTLGETINTLQRLHDEGRDHIWAYYTRNMVRPVALSRSKADVIIGNPPWINYNQTISDLRVQLRRQSEDIYNIWAGGRYATHQDVAGLFFTRSLDLYLKADGVIGMVMPHSALQTGQYSKWRSGSWKVVRDGIVLSADFTYKTAWDLEGLKPNTFFPIPASVVFAQRCGAVDPATPLQGIVERWLGATGFPEENQRTSVPITDTGAPAVSPYADLTRQGATIVPRCLFFINEAESAVIMRAGQTATVVPRRGSQDKAPWKDLDLTAIAGQTIESRHIFNVHLGETVVPYATLDPLKVVLPLKRGAVDLPSDKDQRGRPRLDGLERRMRVRWRAINDLWERNKAPANKLGLIGRLNYMRNLSSQLEWQLDRGDRPVRVVYNSSGAPTAAILPDNSHVVDYTLFWIACKDIDEANYLIGVINSDALYEAVKPLMPKGQFGARHLQKHLWKLPIPEFDPNDELHVDVSVAGDTAAAGAAKQLAHLREERDKLTVALARRELRKWLRASDEGQAVEEVVGRLLGGG